MLVAKLLIVELGLVVYLFCFSYVLEGAEQSAALLFVLNLLVVNVDVVILVCGDRVLLL